MVVSRAYNTLKIDPVRQYIKKSSKNERLRDELDYYSLAQHFGLNNFFVRLVGRGVEGDDIFGLFEYYAYPNLAERWFEGNCDFGKVATKLKEVLDQFIPFTGFRSDPEHNRAMFINKTEQEFHKLIESTPFFDKLPGSFFINGREYYDFSLIWDTIKERIEKTLLDLPTNQFIHGDLCFSNILYGEHNGNSVVKLIDPRGSYGVKGCFGNRLYDLAKLLHSYEGGYEYLIYDRFKVESTANSINFEFQGWNDVAGHFDCLFVSEEEKRNARLIQGLIWLGMVFRHSDSLDRQKVQYAQGIKILNEFI